MSAARRLLGVRAWTAQHASVTDARAPPSTAADASVNSAIVFACQYARLVWLLLHDARNVEEQKDALRAAMAVIGQGPVTIARRARKTRP